MVSRECVHECALYMHVSYQNETVKMKFDCYFLETKSRRYTKLLGIILTVFECCR